jgi:hypothetical protein
MNMISSHHTITYTSAYAKVPDTIEHVPLTAACNIIPIGECSVFTLLPEQRGLYS